jgi:uncharacterized protein (DUF983 family)
MAQMGDAEPRDIWRSLRRGFFGLCPKCGKGKLFCAYLKVNSRCSVCGEDLSHHRADDAPPYFTILIVGHAIGTLILLVEMSAPDLPIWLHLIVWPTLTLVLSLTLLPMIKGALVAYQWALRMHGFGSPEPQEV